MEVEFNNSIRYDIGIDQSDVNKFFGFSYGWHHEQSDRIGFRYNKKTDKVEIVLYSYVLGNRIPTMPIFDLEIGVKYNISLNIDLIDGFRKIKAVIKSDYIPNDIVLEKQLRYENKILNYTLGGYFGGNRKSPHKITIKENRK